MSIRVALVDDQEMIRLGLRMVLDARAEVEVVGEAADGAAAVELAGRGEVDVVLMDVRMPGMDGVEATRRIRERDGAPRVLILTTFDLDEYAYEALRAGASGFLLKDTPVDEILAAIAHIHAGDAVVAPSTTARLLEHVARTRQPAPLTPPMRLEELTDREHDVLLLIAHGRTNAEIAAELGIGEGTVKVHVGRILHKLGLRDRVQAVVLAYETGLVRTERP